MGRGLPAFHPRVAVRWLRVPRLRPAGKSGDRREWVQWDPCPYPPARPDGSGTHPALPEPGGAQPAAKQRKIAQGNQPDDGSPLAIDRRVFGTGVTFRRKNMNYMASTKINTTHVAREHLSRSKVTIRRMVAGLLAGFALASAEAAVLGTFEADRDSWALSLGAEFPGAKGSAERSKGVARTGDYGLKLTADFSEGGRYVELTKLLTPAVDATSLSFWIKTENVAAVGLRMVDSAGRSYQQSFKVPDGAGWKQLVINQLDGGVKPGRARSPEWRGPASGVSLLVEKDSLENQKKAGKVWLDDVEMEGSFVSPLPRIAGLDMRIRTPRPLLYFWGKEDAPTSIVLDFTSATGKAAKLPEIRLLDYHGNAVGSVPAENVTLKQGQTARRKFVVKPPRFGLFSIVIGANCESL